MPTIKEIIAEIEAAIADGVLDAQSVQSVVDEHLGQLKATLMAAGPVAEALKRALATQVAPGEWLAEQAALDAYRRAATGEEEEPDAHDS